MTSTPAFHFLPLTSHQNAAIEVIQFVKSKGLEIRFSSEDSFRSDLVDLLSLYAAVDKVGVNRVGIADTVVRTQSHPEATLIF